MHKLLPTVALAVLLLFLLADCKKSKSSAAPSVNNSVDTNMAGMRTWQEMQVAGSVDSTGVRHHDTTYTSFRTRIIPLSGTMIIFYFDSASTYADTIMSTASNATNVMSFVKSITHTSGSGSNPTVSTTYDSIAFNYYGVYSMIWYHLDALLENTISDSSYSISHTP